MNEMKSLKLMFVVNLVILLSQIHGKKACIEEERIGLLELKSLFNREIVNGSEDVGVLLPSWVDDPTSDCCGWERVTCNSITRRIHRLSLFNIRSDLDRLETYGCYDWNMSLFGSFKDLKTLILAYNCIRWKPKQGLLRLQQLETLDLSRNCLNKSDLQPMRELKSLKKLNLSANCFEFDRVFPARELSAFQNLETLDLSWNHLELDQSPTKNDSLSFSRLTTVMLQGNSTNNISDIQRFMRSLPSLKYLDLSFNFNYDNIGVTLSNQDLLTFGRLEVLDLSSNYLRGAIPRNIGKLSSLKELYLSDNYFNVSSSLSDFCELRKLQVLDIHWNSLEGTLPLCLSKLTSLKYLDLHNNLFSGLIAPYLVPSPNFLEFLDISENNFECSFSLGSFFNHSKLEVLGLGSQESKNKLQIYNDDRAELPLFQLKVLKISDCSVKNGPNFLLNQHRLTFVDISNNKLDGALPTWLLENNTDLTSLNLRNNLFTGKLDPLLQHPRSCMDHMDLSNNHIEGHLPRDLGRVLPNLKYLNLSYNAFEGELPASIGTMRKLERLNLSFNNLSGEVPKELLGTNSSLEVLMLNNNKFHGDFFSTHSNLSNLVVLELASNEFTGSLTTKKEFLIFDVSNNKMTGKIPDGIAAIVLLLQNNSFEGQLPCAVLGPNVEYVDISYNFLSGPIPSCPCSSIVVNLRNNRLHGNIPAQIDSGVLRILLLGNNRLSGLIPRWLCQSSRISILDLSANSFSGSIPSCLSNVTFYKSTSIAGSYSNSVPLNYVDLTFEFKIDFVTKNSLLPYRGNILSYMSGLDLSCNNLTGAIPPSLGELSSIHALNLSHNHLTGHIPVSFSNLSQIESLDFSHNSLSGKIPTELVRLNFLEVFSVAHNNLSGRVPDKGQFATFGINSYEGNPFLTGIPSEKNRTKVVERPLPSDDETEKWYGIDRTSFLASLIATYCVILVSFGAVLYINPYWRRWWFYLIENFIYSSYYFVVDTCRKLATIFNN